MDSRWQFETVFLLTTIVLAVVTISLVVSVIAFP